jgi:integrase
MSNAKNPPNDASNSILPSFAELRVRLLADQALPLARQRDMASALTALAKALGRLPETILADPKMLRAEMKGLTAAMVGLKAGRWRNVKSLVGSALAHFGIAVVQGRNRIAPSPAWLAILELLDTGPGPHFHMWRFARYCRPKGIEPPAVDDSVIATYQQDLVERSLASDPARAAREVARFWNKSADTISVWPQSRLIVPDNRHNYALPLESYPESLVGDVNAWCAGLVDADPFADRPFSPLRPTSVQSRRKQLRTYLGALVLQGVDPADMTSLATVVMPERAKLALRYFWEKAGKKATTYTYHEASMVLMIARHWAKLPDADIKCLSAIAKQLRPKTSGMTGRNTSRLQHLEDPTTLRSLLNLPSALLADVRRLGPPSVQTALDIQTAVAIELLIHIPMRLGNLQNLRIGVHLLRNVRNGMSIAIKADEVKNNIAIDASLSARTTALIARYLDRYRPLLAEHGDDCLFPGERAGIPKSDQRLRSQIQKAIAERCGLKFHPHLFRHMAAWITLRNNPTAHGQVQRVLGHKSLGSTMAFYSGMETPAARQHYDELIAGHRRPPNGPPQKPRPRGGK